MAQQPISQSDTLGLHAQKTATDPAPSPELSPEFNLAEFPSLPVDSVQAALLAEVSAVSVDLLNDIVERARSATNASGAAIALGRGDDIVCLAETGSSAPSVGARLNLKSGLSGACVQSKTFQRCDDSETDPRVDPELCRRLGLRSMLVFPILRRDVLLGLVEVFSPNAHAFSDREVQALASLSRTISYILDSSAVPAAQQVFEEPPLEAAPEAFVAATAQQVSDEPPLEAAPEVFVAASEAVAHEEPLAAVSEAEVALPTTLKQDYWTTVLTVAVIVLAITLGWLLGRGGLRRAGPPPNNPAPTQQASLPPQSTPVPPAAAGNPAAAAEKPPSTPAPKHESAAPPNPHPGELVISQNGKVIYRQPGSQPESATNVPPVPNPPSAQTGVSNAVLISSETANQFLVQRVEPEYPESARDQRIQGPVTLEAVVGKDGSVKTLKTVSGDPQLAAAARHAVSQWRFKPFLRDGKPVEFQTQVTVNFRLP